jgi:hypothetical protein
MPTAVRDASVVTKRNQGIAANAYYNQWKSATNTMSNMALKAPGASGAESLISVRVGCTACAIVSNDLNVGTAAYDVNLGAIPNRSGARSGLTGQS